MLSMFFRLIISFLLILSINEVVAQQPKLMLPVGHRGDVTFAIFSPDGKKIVTTSSDNTARIWDVNTGKILSNLIGHTDEVTSATFSPDEKKIVTLSYDNTARIWDAASGKLQIVLRGHTDEVTSATFSPDGKTIVTVSLDSSAKIWDAGNGKSFATVTGHIDEFSYVTFSPDRRKIVIASDENTARIWDAGSGKQLVSLIGHMDEVTSVTFSPDGEKIITTSYDSTAKIWDSGNGKLIVTLTEYLNKVLSVSFSPDGKKIVTTSSDNTARIRDVNTGKILFNLIGHTNEVKSATFSPAGKKIITTSYDSTVRIWDAESGRLLIKITGHISYIWDAIFSPDEKKIVTFSWNGASCLYDASSGKHLIEIQENSEFVNSIAYSPDGKKIATTSRDATVRIRDAVTGKLIKKLSGHTKDVEFSTFSPDEKKILTTSNNNALIWSSQTGQLQNILFGHTDEVTSATFSRDGKKILTTSKDKSACLWSSQTGQLQNVLFGHTDEVTSATFSPDGKKIVTTSNDKTAIIWDVASGKLLATLRGHTSWVTSANFSLDGSKIVTGSWDKTAKKWDVSTGKLLGTWSGVGSVDFISVSPDGKNLMTVGFSGVFIFDFTTGKRIWKISENKTRVRFANFSPDGKKIVIVYWDNKNASLLDASNGKLLELDLYKGDITEELTSANFSPDGKKIMTIGHSVVLIWDAVSGKLFSALPKHYDRVYNSAKFSPNNKRIITTSNDHTIKIMNTINGNLVYTSIALDSNDYFSQIPSGYYLCSPGAAKLLHYVTDDLKVITFEQLDVKYNRPDKVLEAIGNTDTALIKSYRKAYQKRIKKLGIDTTAFRDGYSVPEADFKHRDEIEYEQKNGKLNLQISAGDSTYTLDRFNIWVNEVPIYGQRGVNIKMKNTNTIDTIVTINLSQGENRIETSITNVNGTESYRMPLNVNYTAAEKQKSITRFIGIGIDKFSDSQYNLQYSSKDIRDLAKKLKEKYKDDIIIDTLFNENVTLSNVKALKQKLQQTSVNDKVIISYSGHGMLSKDYDYYLSTYTVNFQNPEENGLPYDELENLLDSIPARKKLMLIDACHSGEVDKDERMAMQKMADSLGLSKGIIIEENTTQTQRLGLKNSFEMMQSLFVNVGKSTGATIISAAAGNQFALERGDLKNGVFTYSILEAMEKNSSMKISELKKIVGKRVEQLTNGMQKPTSRNETIAVDWEVW